jgi:hypothetical protein
LGSTLGPTTTGPLATAQIHVSCLQITSDARLPVGYEGARETRCTDRFVRYPYPKLFSSYKQNFANKHS